MKVRIPVKHRKYLDTLAAELSISKQSDWYEKRIGTITSKGFGKFIRKHYGGSYLKALERSYPEYTWYGWCFKHAPPKFWSDVVNQRKYFDWIAEQLHIETQQDWYHIDISKALQLEQSLTARSKLQHLCRDPIVESLAKVYKEFEWYPWLFERVPKNYWNHQHNRRKYFDWLADELGIRNFTEWYSVLQSDVEERGGSGLLQSAFSNCFIRAITETYPEENWDTWRFRRAPTNFWKDENNVNKYMDWLGEKLGISRPEDWYRVTTAEIIQLGGNTIVRRGIHHILMKQYPEYEWTPESFFNWNKSQQCLLHTIHELFSNSFKDPLHSVDPSINL